MTHGTRKFKRRVLQMGNLAVCDPDEGYVRCLTQYFSEKDRMPFSIFGFSRERELADFAERSGIDVLLVSPEMLTARVRQLNIGKIVILADGETTGEESMDESFSGADRQGNIEVVRKFQSTENIIREVMDICSDGVRQASGLAVQAGGARVNGVYSPAGRCGKTTFAVTLGQAAARSERVIFIDMDEFSGFETLLGRKSGGNLSDLLYYCKLNPANLGMKLKSVTCNLRGLDVIAPMSYSSDLRDISTDEWKELVGYVAGTCGYDRVILDINSAVRDPLELLGICDVIYMPVTDDAISAIKIREFEHYLVRTEREETLYKIKKIKLPVLKDEFVRTGYMEQLLLSPMGAFAEEVLCAEK